jgi:hypothetical protein
MAEPSPPPHDPPPRAFTQGVGQVLQGIGVVIFLVMFFICCGSSLLSKDWATKTSLTQVGWGKSSVDPRQPAYSAQMALTICVFAGVFFGMALAGVGLGMQAESRHAPAAGVMLTICAGLFWTVHVFFAIHVNAHFALMLVAVANAGIFWLLMGFAIQAFRETRENPAPEGHDVLPPGYKIPYSHYHDDPPEVRLAAELQQRRERLAVQQKELEALEQKIKRSLEDDPHREEPP